MKLLNRKGVQVGTMFYNDGTNVNVGDIIKCDKVYKVVKRVWEASVGEITTVFVDEIESTEKIFE